MENQIVYRTAKEVLNIVTNYHSFDFDFDSKCCWIADFKVTDMEKVFQCFTPIHESPKVFGEAKFRIIVDVMHLNYEYDEEGNILNEDNLEEVCFEMPFEQIEEIIKESLLNKFNDGLIDSRLL